MRPPTQGDFTNPNRSIIIEAADCALGTFDAPPEAKEHARGVLRRMLVAGGEVASGTVSALLAAAVQKASGLSYGG